ncbi:sacsin N-terminal ATP-binding-like domain-containing protein [Candidatus Venteria ishoeyi]|uniref:Sacsin/Nov domain-containing protein n=1 Tax=Candidatus Venteria ishoeyi TaxID=1899563 RepID=A0A1H6FD03_9GAMM|nr:hypothetical protein [Candidatus Venteria ishoeyi]SEH07962.1 Uncharacterised protein [Candidatus Venteria ishoeyi]
MSGFIDDPLQRINLIADNLKDRYRSGFPILKELLQNADDGDGRNGATCFEFGYHPGLSEAEHPLLQGPALFFINNGAFSANDDRGIRSFGLSHKPSEHKAIGQFGLGMKSIFHWCEAFFYLTNEPEFRQILNPWQGDGASPNLADRNNSWAEFSKSDQNCVIHELDSILTNHPYCFILWVPLRLKAHLRTNDRELGAIMRQFCGEETNRHIPEMLQDALLPQKCATLLPLLKNVHTIRLWKSDKFPQGFTVSLADDSKRIRFDKDTSDTRLAGKINCADTPMMFFSGREYWIEGEHLNSLPDSAYWPKSFIRNEDGYEEEKKAKAEPHCAVVFTRADAPEDQQGELLTRWAVFLPLASQRNSSGQRKDRVTCEGRSIFMLTLHGYFFVDAGRQGILLGDPVEESTDEETLCKTWNVLLKQALLTKVLPTLEQFVADTELKLEEIKHLSVALKKTTLFQENQDSIYQNHQWVYALTPKGGQWSLVSQDILLLPLPPPPKSAPRRPWETLNLDSLPDNTTLVDIKQPNLLPNVSPQWKEEVLSRVLDIDVATVFKKNVLLKYFDNFLESISYCIGYGTAQERLRKILKEVFRSFDYAEVDAEVDKASLQGVIKKLNADSRLTVGRLPIELFRALSACNTSLLLIPQELEPQGKPGTGKPEDSELIEWLKVLDSFSQKPDYADDCAEASGTLLNLLDTAQRKGFLKRESVARLRILRAYDCAENRHLPASIVDINKCKIAGTLFGYSQGVRKQDRAGLGLLLQAVLPKNRILLINQETAELLDIQSRPCNAATCLRMLGHGAKELGSPQLRSNLIQHLSGENLDADGVRAIRYLLHGDAEHFIDSQVPLWVRGYQQNPVWEKIWLQLNQGQSEPWNLLKPTLLELVPRGKWREIGIQEIKSQEVLQELTTNIGSLQRDAFSPNERELILAEVQDESLWCSLPLHLTVEGRLVTVSENTYLAEGNLDLEMASSVCLIKPSQNERVSIQQKKWLEPLTPKNILKIILNHESPQGFYLKTLDILEQLGPENLSDFGDDLRNKKWLLDRNDKPLSPRDVIHLPKLVEEIAQLIPETHDSGYWEPKLLADSIRRHGFYGELQPYFANPQDSLMLLGELLVDKVDYHLGNVQVKNSEELEKLYGVLKDCPQAKGWKLLAKAGTAYGVGDCHHKLFPPLNKVLPVKHIVEILNWLSEQGNGGDTQLAFNVHLSVFTREPGASSYLPELKLLNQAGDWKSPEKLCVIGEGIDKSYILDKQQAQLLQSLLPEPEKESTYGVAEHSTDVKQLLKTTPDRLNTYFSPWEKSVPSTAIIGMFLSILGNDEKLLEIAGHFLGRHSVEWVRSKLSWKVPSETDHDNRHCELFGYTLSQVLAEHHFVFEQVEDKQVKALSVIDTLISVPISQDFKSLIVGGLYYYDRHKHNLPGITIRLRLRKLNPDNFSEQDLSNFLLKSVEYIWRKAYNQTSALSELWEDIEQSEQFDIEVARSLILDNLPFYIRQLGAHKTHKKLHSRLNQWNEAHRKVAEYHNNPENRKKQESKKRQALNELEQLITNNHGAQGAVLQAVKRHISDFQYEPASVLFEIFQNADDAVSELLLMRQQPDTAGDEELPSIARTFVLQVNAQQLLFMHWGRLLNDYGRSDTFRKQGFDQDLEKMLMLSASDKQSSHEDQEITAQVTGKFGLGFKSLFLICDKPRIISGRLELEIVGGLLPRNLEHAEDLRGVLTGKTNDRGVQGTLIAADVTQEYSRPGIIYKKFKSLAGYLTVFAREIRRIEIAETILQWQPESLGSGIETGEIQTPDESFQALYFRYDAGGILLRLGADGFRALPKDVPKFWVLTSTQEESRCGFAVNGQFDVDAGRARLSATSMKNQKISEKLGRQFGEGLCHLFQQEQNILLTKLHLRPELPAYALWCSLWEVLTSGWNTEDRIDSLLREILCENRGLGQLITEHPALPSGLPGCYETLTIPQNIRYVITGKLVENKFLTALSQLPVFKKKLQPGQAISNEIKKDLQRILPNFAQAIHQWTTLTLADALDWLTEGNLKHITKKVAQTLGSVLTREFVNDYKKKEGKEAERLVKVLRKLEFKTDATTWVTADKLLAGQQQGSDSKEEIMRLAFAPDNLILSGTYTDKALSFFLACRDKMDAPVDTMREWIISADTDKKKQKALRYLLDGDLGEKLAKQLRDRGLYTTWLERSQLNFSSPLLEGWSQKEKEDLILRRLTTDLNQDPPPPSLPDIEKLLDPSTVLPEIYEWWEGNGSYHLTNYETETYPRRIVWTLTDNPDDEENRKNWLILLILGAMHKIPRTTRKQHRGFIEKCQYTGWWDTFATTNPIENPDRWIAVLEDYIAAQYGDIEQYAHWMQLFPTIYRVARWLDDYIALFSEVDRQANEAFNLRNFLQPRIAPKWQGGGIDAPPLQHTLSLGACFVVRELVRKQVVKPVPALTPYCYVPVKRTRDLLGRMGCNACDSGADIDTSKEIHKFLVKHLGEERATFDGAFDIPLQLWAENQE